MGQNDVLMMLVEVVAVAPAAEVVVLSYGSWSWRIGDLVDAGGVG